MGAELNPRSVPVQHGSLHHFLLSPSPSRLCAPRTPDLPMLAFRGGTRVPPDTFHGCQAE